VDYDKNTATSTVTAFKNKSAISTVAPITYKGFTIFEPADADGCIGCRLNGGGSKTPGNFYKGYIWSIRAKMFAESDSTIISVVDTTCENCSVCPTSELNNCLWDCTID
jgi:hypothetical protein